MPPLRLPGSMSSRQGQSQFCNPHTRACQSPGMQGSRVFRSSSPRASQILDPGDSSSFPPVSYKERSLKFTPSCQGSLSLGLSPGLGCSCRGDQGSSPHWTPASFLPPVARLPSPFTLPHLVSQPGQDRRLESLSH